MLSSLRIRDLVIIEDVTLALERGLNVLTGETGAGKSILVDALALVSGGRADRSLVRAGRDRAIVEALFDCVEHPEILAAAREAGVDDDEGQFLVRREIAAAGGSRVLINGSPATRGVLRAIGERLLALHGQNDQVLLTSGARQSALLDAHAIQNGKGHAGKLEAVRGAFARLKERQAQLESVTEALEHADRRTAELAEIVAAIDEVGPEPGERERLERERNRVLHGERIRELLVQASGCLYDGEPAAAGLAAQAAKAVEDLAEIDAELAESAGRLRGVTAELQDIGAALRDRLDADDFEGGDIETIESRRAALDRLSLRFGEDEQAILAVREAAAEELAALGEGDARVEAAQAAVAQARAEFDEAARALTQSRRRAAKRLGAAVTEQLPALALEGAEFRVGFKPIEAGHAGVERALFEWTANPGQPHAELARSASGGELSRLMLALQVVAGGQGEATPVMVFDEVDSGVGGAVADAVGARLQRLAAAAQVLCVTHSPQVAAYGDQHVNVTKRRAGQSTAVELTALDRGARVEELARMLAGRTRTESSLRHAGDLLDAARRETLAAPGRES